MKASALTTEMIPVQGALAQVAFRRSERARKISLRIDACAWRHRDHAAAARLAPGRAVAAADA